jgi:cytochrome P450
MCTLREEDMCSQEGRTRVPHDAAIAAFAATLPQASSDPALPGGRDHYHRQLLADRLSWSEGAVVVAPHALVTEVLTDADTYRATRVIPPLPHGVTSTVLAALEDELSTAPTLSTTDGPDHMRMRRIVDQAFTDERVTSRIGLMVHQVSSLLARRESRRWAELRAHVVAPCVDAVVDDLFGFPPRDRRLIHGFGEAATLLANGRNAPAAPLLTAIHIHKHQQYIAQLVTEQTAAMQRGEPCDNLITDLVRAHDDTTLTGDELRWTIFEARGQASEPTVLMILSVVDTLLRTGAWAQLQHTDPDDRTARISRAVDEIARIRTPRRGVLRTTSREVELDGRRLPEGTPLVCMIAAANLDADVFPRPHDLVLTRQNRRDHLTFGAGAHHCAGAKVATTIARVVIDGVLSLPNLRLARPEHYEQTASRCLSGPKSLLVSWHDAATPPTGRTGRTERT